MLIALRLFTDNTDEPFMVEPGSNNCAIVFFSGGYGDKVDCSKYADELDSILQLLVNTGKICQLRENKYALTQSALHRHQFSFDAFLEYAKDNLMAFIAIVISIVALYLSIKGYAR